MSNFGAGFEAFQSEMLSAAEIMGDDALAHMWAEHLFDDCLRQVMRMHPQARHMRPYGFPAPHNSEWLRATGSDFDEAINLAKSIYKPEPEHDVTLWSGPVFVISASPHRCARLSPKGGAVLLAYRAGGMVTATPAGYALAASNGTVWRSYYRTCRSVKGAQNLLKRWGATAFQKKAAA